jgi:hypothetical protein
MVEMALGTLVFITVLVFGIHFAEIGYLSLKVQEAASSALWDATAYKMHTLPDDFGPLDALISSGAAQRAQDRYKDLDGRSSQNNSEVYTQVFTQSQNVTVSCKPAGPHIQFAPQAKSVGVFQDKGGMSCTAEAVLSPWKMPLAFVERPDSGGIFQSQHYRPLTMRICASGRALGGSCDQGKLSVLLDDWGLAGAEESRDCDLLNCANTGYKASAEKVFDNNGRAQGIFGTTFLEDLVGATPPGYDENKFFMSFVGGDKDFLQETTPGSGDVIWPTTPGGSNSYDPEYRGLHAERGDCFLGQTSCL